MHIVIRADASPTIGTGHVARCVALAQALETVGAQVTLVTRDLGLDLASLISPRQHVVLRAPAGSAPIGTGVPHAAWAGVSEAQDAAETAAAIGRDADWIVVDHYAFGAAWHDAVRTATGARLAAIDDLADRALAADLIIDHTYWPGPAGKYDGVAPGQPSLVGPRFALLGPGYADAPRYTMSDCVRSIGVFMGGVDAVGASGAVIEALRSLNLPVEVATTSANPHLAALRAAGANLLIDAVDLTAFFARHDLQIGAGGGAAWERCCIGAPTLALVLAENQRAVTEPLAQIGVVATLGSGTYHDGSSLLAALSALIDNPAGRRTLSQNARTLVDGLGARRVAVRIAREAMTVRPATAADSATIFAWRNHPATRGVSRSDRPIGQTEHDSWLARVLADPGHRLLIAQIGPLPVGVIRYDPAGPNAVEVSLYLDPALHGLGLGRRMLSASERAVLGLDIHAEVLEGNEGSARMFERAGYDPRGPGRWIRPARTAAGAVDDDAR